MELEREAELLYQLEKGEDMATLCSSSRELANHVIDLVNAKKHDEMMHCMSGLLDIYNTTSKPIVTTAIENIFVYNVGSHLLLQNGNRHMADIFPECFLEILKMQMVGSKI